MSSRNYHAALLAVLTDPAVALVRFVELQFSTGTLYLHTDLGDIVGNDADGVSRTWTGVGGLGSIGSIEETDKLDHPADVSLQLSGLDTTIIDQVLNQNFMERTVRVYVSARNVVTGSLVIGPQLDLSGRINGMDVLRDTSSMTVSVRVRSRYSEIGLAQLLYFTDAQHQATNPGDLFFEYLEQMQDAKLIWGDKHATLNFGKTRGGRLAAFGTMKKILGGTF